MGVMMMIDFFVDRKLEDLVMSWISIFQEKKEDQAQSLRDIVSEEKLGTSDVVLTNKIGRLIEEVRKEMTKKYKLKKPLSDMNWNEKIDSLPSEAWMIEQVIFFLEGYIRRSTAKKNQPVDTFKGVY